LGPVVGSLCDTINTVVEPNEISSPALYLSYKSTWQSVIVNASRLKGNKVKIYIMDISGRILFVDEGKTSAGYFSKNIPMENLAAGIYLVTIVTEKEKLSGKIVKE
ncbi:MAG: T9SS type A sorting domain-containing protein, partial [Bacteroidota bacterium]